jgi:hypothetical protein
MPVIEAPWRCHPLSVINRNKDETWDKIKRHLVSKFKAGQIFKKSKKL